MWWKRSPPETNSMTKKSLSVVWKEANMLVRNLRWESTFKLANFAPALRAHGQNLSFEHADVGAILTQNLLLTHRLDGAKLFVWFSFPQDHLRHPEMSGMAKHILTLPYPPRPRVVLRVKPERSILIEFSFVNFGALFLYSSIPCSWTSFSSNFLASFFLRFSTTLINLVKSTPHAIVHNCKRSYLSWRKCFQTSRHASWTSTPQFGFLHR